MLSLLSPLLPANTFTVNSTLDTCDANPGNGVAADSAGRTTLRAAIMEANARAGADTINLPAGTYVLTLAGINEDACRTGDLDITDPLTITGAGSASTIIDGNGLDTVFSTIPDYMDLGWATTISGVTIRNGHNSSDRSYCQWGGALNWVGGSPGLGQTSVGTLTMSNCVISGCTSQPGIGGGISLIYGNAQFTNCTISGCSCAGTDVQYSVGGGVCVDSTAAATFTNCTFSGNSAAEGGGIYSYGPLTLKRCVVSGNSATASVSYGGGIYSTASTAITDGSVVSNNTAALGGGLYWSNTDTSALSISETAFTNNSATYGGGAIEATNTQATGMSVHFCRFSGNTASTGSALYASSTFVNLDATNNWWGRNTGPGANVAGNVTSSPWLQLTLSTSGGSVERGATANLTASLNRNSASALVGGASASVPDATPISWNATGGTIKSGAATSFTNGDAAAQFGGAATIAPGSASATVDSQTVTVTENTVPVQLSGWQLD